MKLSRLPLRYFDRQSRGEILSRVTNDIDNIAQTLQQTMSQLLTSVLTIVGVLAMMFWISLDPRADRAGHGPGVGVRRGADRQAGAAAVHPAVVDDRQAQRTHRGDVHRTLAGQGVRPAAGGDGGVRRAQRQALQRVVPGAVRLRAHPADDDVHRQPQLRAGRRHRRPAGGVRRSVDRRRAGVHPVLAPVQPADHAGRVDGEPAAVRGRLGRAGLRAARRAGAVAGSGDAGAAARHPRVGSRSTMSRSATTRTYR